MVIPKSIKRANCSILVQEIRGCDSNSTFTTLPGIAGTPFFTFLEKKKGEK